MPGKAWSLGVPRGPLGWSTLDSTRSSVRQKPVCGASCSACSRVPFPQIQHSLQPLKSNGKNIVLHKRRCSIIYSGLQLLQLLPTRRKERSRAVKATSAPPCGPAQKRWPARSATSRAQPYRPPLRLFTNCQKNFNARKSVNIAAIRPGGFLILIWGDALSSHLSVDVSGMSESFLITHFFDLFLRAVAGTG